MRSDLLAAAACACAAVLPLGGCTLYGDTYGESYASGFSAPPDTPYYAERYYKADPRYPERRLGPKDAIYMGSDGRYYCKRPDGTSGLIVAGIDEGALANLIQPGHSRTLGSITSPAIDRKKIRCH